MKKLFLLLAFITATQSSELYSMQLFKKLYRLVFRKSSKPKVELQDLAEVGIKKVEKVEKKEGFETKKIDYDHFQLKQKVTKKMILMNSKAGKFLTLVPKKNKTLS